MTPARALVVLALVVLASVAHAQPATKVPRVGYLSQGSAESGERLLAAFRQGLRDAGYEDGRTNDRRGEGRTMRWVTFDCFGTLVDWKSGFAAILAPLVGDRTRAVLAAYDRIEPLLEQETPHRLYKDVLTIGLLRAAQEVAVPLSEAQARALPQRWGTQPVFADVEPMLAELRAAGHRLAILTNCDDDLFAQTQRAFREPFDLVVTAERVRDYKPSPAHFQHFRRASGAGPGEWVHVANSWFHDITPARELGIPRVWLDRDDTGQDPAGASARVRAGGDVRDAVARLFRR